MREVIRNAAASFALVSLVVIATPAHSQGLPPELPNRPTKEQLANDNNLFIALAKKVLKWEEPTEPVQIAGPIYFVGTKGLGAFLITTSEGHVLMNTGMPSSGRMIVDSIPLLTANTPPEASA